MANENDKIIPDDKDSRPQSWIENIANDMQKLDAEFPLSGGETEEDFEKAAESDTDGKKTSFFDDLDTEFPLSGGEVER